MLPIVLDPNAVAIGLAGADEGLERRRATLAEAGLIPCLLPPMPGEGHLRGLSVLFIAGLRT